MKAIICLLTTFALLLLMRAEEPKPSDVKPEELQNLQTYGAIDLAAGNQAADLLGKVIKLRYTAQVALAKPPESGEWMGRLVEVSSRKGKDGRVDIVIPEDEAARNWYRHVSYNQGGATKTVIVRVLAKEGELVRVRALGRDVRNVTTKPEFVW